MVVPEQKPESVICPLCGETRPFDDEDELYECTNCGKEGYDCCIPGTNAICQECENKIDIEEGEVEV